ncbi:MAG: ABC exporter membrane fusion protein [Moorea sp. SIO1G6]|uniref:ABC exporter membrane fusion protein n=1 Tax=Moorena producens (strain JHB) TaxID=1454205 RepID=A0A1D9FTX4_MOOP1|nr:MULTISPECIES: ABC exporter membrane fusion protein [Moorena]AOY78812.1 ABC exporter membrane fusion protein [Moorena producens JHB]NET66152.1 ABC exporter membrane fusion protein [Moorena sp. SIO1G6]
MEPKIGIKDQGLSKPLSRWVIVLAGVGILATVVASRYSLEMVRERPPEPVPSPSTTPAIRAVTALGRLEPEGEVIQLAAPTTFQAPRVAQLLVKEGDRVGANQLIAIMENRGRLQADLERAKAEVKVSRANLEKVKAGAKSGTIAAQEAKIKRLEAEYRGQKEAQQTRIDRLQTQLQETQQEKDATVRRLEAQLRNVQADFQRYDQLERDGAIAISELDSRRLNVETAQESVSEAIANRTQTISTLREQLKEAIVNRNQTLAVVEAQINEAKATLEEIKEVRLVDITQAEAELEMAMAQVKQAEAELKFAYVHSPLDSQILKINTYPGETVDQEKGIVELGQTDQMMVVAEVYESDIGKVKLGQKVTIISESKAFEGKLNGSVVRIGQQIDKQDVLDTDPAADVDARVVEVDIRLNPEDSKTVTDLTNSQVIVKIVISD